MPRLETNPSCPRCNKSLGSYTAITPDTKPKQGDVTICTECFAVLEFTEDIMLINASVETIEEIDLLELSQAVNAAKEFKARVDRANKFK